MWMAKLDLLVHHDLCYLQHQPQEQDHHVSPHTAQCCGGHTCEVLHWSQSGGERWLSPRYEPTQYFHWNYSSYIHHLFPLFWSSVMKNAFSMWGSDTARIEGAAKQPSIKFLSSVTKSKQNCRFLEPLDLFIIHPDIVKMQLHRDWQEAGQSLQNYDKECTDDGM